MVQTSDLILAQESPLTPDLTRIFDRHTRDMHADTPPESIHMMPRASLEHPEIAFFVLRDAGRPVGMGAVKRISPDHGEVKSMHVLSEERGRGLSVRLLAGLIDHARRLGLSRLSLETGSQAMFLPARRLYERAGFTPCAPFGEYGCDLNSVYMTIVLDQDV